MPENIKNIKKDSTTFLFFLFFMGRFQVWSIPVRVISGIYSFYEKR